MILFLCIPTVSLAGFVHRPCHIIVIVSLRFLFTDLVPKTQLYASVGKRKQRHRKHPPVKVSVLPGRRTVEAVPTGSEENPSSS
uniref:Putative secreted protein n=1 Tax=Anopheles darlingi TaxID=43151 RepID=A0A2M4D756_ANODA